MFADPALTFNTLTPKAYVTDANTGSGRSSMTL